MMGLRLLRPDYIGTHNDRKRRINSAATMLFILMVILLPIICEAGVGTTSVVFLEETIGTRPYGMGGAFSAVSDDANSIYSNPAGYHYLPYSEITTMYNKMLMDTSMSYIGYVQPFKRFGTISFSYLSYDGGSVELNYLDGTSETVKAAQDWAASTGYGTNIVESFFVGGNIKLIKSTLAEKYSAIAIAFDIGGLYRTIDSKFSFGLALYNIGTNLKYKNLGNPLPSNTKLGIGYKLLENEINSILTAADVVFGLNDKTTKMNLGLEYWLLKTLAIRLGYNPSSFTIGLGINAFGGILDYGYVPMLDEATHRVSFSLNFGSRDKIALAEKYEEKGMYERAQYIRSPEDYMYAKATSDSEKEQFSPVITSIEPKSASPGSEVKIYGRNFSDNKSAVTVKFSDKVAEIIESDSRRIIVKVPVTLKPGKEFITVTTYKGTTTSESLSVRPLKSAMLKVVQVSFEDENKDNVLSAEEKGSIKFIIQNQKGAGESFGVTVKPVCLNSKIDISFEHEIFVGDIAPGSQKEVIIPIKGGMDIPTDKVSFELNFTEANGSNPDSAKITFPTHKLEPPDIQLARIEIDDGIYPDDPEKLAVGNNNGIVEAGESVEITTTVINKGTGPTRYGYIEVACNDSKITLLTQPAKFSVGRIESGKWEEIKFAIRVEKQYSGSQNLPIKLQFTEDRKQFNREISLNVGLGRVYAKVQEVEIKGKQIETIMPSIPTFGDDLLNLPTYTTGKKQNAYAVVVGIEKYRDIISAEYASKDAQTVRDYLINAMGFKEENVMYALNERASRNDLIKYFNVWLKNNVEEDSIVFVYYSGHGAPDPTSGESYIVPYDGAPNTIKDSGFSLKQLYESLNKLPTQCILVVIDACFSGAGGPRTVLAKGSRPLVVIKEIETGSTVVLAATGGGQISGSYEEKQHGLFTYFFLKGLQGEADINKDKKILLSELYEYLKPQVIKIARKNNREQEPQILPSISQIGQWLKLPLAVLK